MGALVAVLPPSFVPGPTGDGASLAAIGIDMIIPTLSAWFLNPGDKTFEPNTADQRHYDATIVRTEANYQNVLGFDAKDLPTDWGDLGTPIVAHANAEVVVRVESPFLANWTDDSDVLFPTGSTSLRWTAATQWDPLLDTAIPAALYFIATKTTCGKAFIQVQLAPKTAARSIETGLLILINAAIEAGIVTAGMIDDAVSMQAFISKLRRLTCSTPCPPSVSAEGEVVTCDLGTLSPGQTVEITVELLTDPNFDSELLGYTVDATGSNTAIIGIPVMPQNIFFDDFE